MNQMDGGLAALVIQELSKELKASKEDELRIEIRRVIREALDCPPEIEIPDRFVNALMRGSRLSPEAWERIRESAQSIALEIAVFTMDSKDQRPQWTINFLSQESATVSHPVVSSDPLESLVLKIVNDEQISELRSVAQATRNQTSFIRGVCRVLYTSWIDEVADLGRHLNRRLLESKQAHFIEYQITSIDELMRWADLLFDYFDSMAENNNGVKGHKAKLISSGAVRTYKNAWESLLKRHSHQIFETMHEQAISNRPSTSERYELFHRSIQASSEKDFKLNLRESMREEPDNRRHFLQALTALEPTAFSSSALAEAAPTAGTTHASEVHQHGVKISIDFRDSDAELQSMSMAWPTLDEAISQLTEWFFTRQSLIGNVVIEAAKIEVYHEGKTEKHELVHKTLNNIEEFFFKVISLPYFSSDARSSKTSR